VPRKQTNDDGFPADLLVELDRRAGRSLSEQLERELRDAIQLGRLEAGAPLPASRTLASELGVSRSTVVEAYGRLTADGYLDARQGAGTYVRATVARAPAAPPAAAPAGDRMLGGLPDPALFDRRAWLRHYRAALAAVPDAQLGYPGPSGAPALRAALTAYLGRVRGVATDREHVLVTTGFTQALVLTCRALARRGARRVAVEDPCFGLHRHAIAMTGLEPVPVPVDDDGLDIGRLPDSDVAAVLVAPAHSYPLGTVLGARRRHGLIAWARRCDAWIIEDDYDAEFRYDRTPIGALQGLAPDRVIYAGGASKTLTPALRLGWMAVPSELAAPLQAEKLFDDMGSGLLDQLALARFLDAGDFARHLRRVRPVYRRRRDTALRALAAALPTARPGGVAAGLHVHVALAPGTDEASLIAAAHRRGAFVEGAAWHWADPESAPPGIVVGYSGLGEPALRRAIGRLATTP
jgi:GntR family transcriptional regulator/MocR family aminotransferase